MQIEVNCQKVKIQHPNANRAYDKSDIALQEALLVHFTLGERNEALRNKREHESGL